MTSFDHHTGCGSSVHFDRRTLLGTAGAMGAAWLTPLSRALAQEKHARKDGRPKSVIVLWMQGGPSQLETFDPHPGKMIGGDTKAIKTSVKGIEIGDGLPQVAEQMEHLAVVRSVVSKEGDHERATYNVKTGFRPDPTLVHPALGAVVCHKLTDELEIPRHISIFPGQWPARGGYLGDHLDAFKINNPVGRVPDVSARVPKPRFDRRVEDIDVIEDTFARGRLTKLENKTLHRSSLKSALKMMTSEQLAAFDVTDAPKDLKDRYGDTRFGRGCLAAVQLIESGVRCVEVTLNGWDSHVNNHENQYAQLKVLDPAYATLIQDLKDRDLLDSTIVLWGGEFGRTPRINPLGGRDHWPHGFSVAIAGGGFRGGIALGETSPDMPSKDKEVPKTKGVANPRNVEDIHATIFAALGIDFEEELETPIGRPMAISKGKVIKELMA